MTKPIYWVEIVSPAINENPKLKPVITIS
jgi:hypothetical protein